MGRQPVSEFGGDASGLGERFGRERRELVPVLVVARKRKHLTAKPHKLDAVLVVPSEHLDDIPRIGESDFLDVALPAGNVGRLGLVRAVFGRVLRGGGVAERVAMVEDGLYATCAGAEDGWVTEAEVGVEAGLKKVLERRVGRWESRT